MKGALKSFILLFIGRVIRDNCRFWRVSIVCDDVVDVETLDLRFITYEMGV